MRFNVLVADDEKNIREGLAEALSQDGYGTILAADGDEAVARIDRGDVDLVITDLRMPARAATRCSRTSSANTPASRSSS
jgi:CheY-like chemotaxis protein